MSNNLKGRRLEAVLLRIKLLLEYRFAVFVALLGLSLFGAKAAEFRHWVP